MCCAAEGGGCCPSGTTGCGTQCCGEGETCCGGLQCCDPAFCCDNGECCSQECEGCLDHGSLSGGTIDVSPEVVCIGETITFTASGVTDDGGIKRVECSAKEPIGPGSIVYSWTLTIPPDYPEPLPPLSGTGNTVSVLAKVAGTYTVTFGVSVQRECEPAPIELGPLEKTLTFAATMTLDPSRIPAKTAWPGMPAGESQSDITVTWDPPECPGRLEVVELVGTDGYTPPNEGTLAQIDETHWHYVAFDEPQTELCSKDVKVWIAAFQGDVELTRKSILVAPVHVYWTQGSTKNFLNDYNFLRWKYAPVLATTLGAFTSVTISTNSCVECRIGLLTTVCVPGCTDENGNVEFGTDAFTGSENAAASIIGHELIHTTPGGDEECPAYTWEFEHDDQTGIFQCDSDYLADVVQQMNCQCDGINCPE